MIWIVYILYLVKSNVIHVFFIATQSDLMLFSIYIPSVYLHTGRYHVKYLWTKHNTYVNNVAQLKLITLEHVNMARAKHIFTCEHCMISQLDDFIIFL